MLGTPSRGRSFISSEIVSHCLLSKSKTMLLFVSDSWYVQQVLKADAQKAFTMLKKMTVEPSEVGSPKASKNAMIPLDFLKRAKVSSARHNFTIQAVLAAQKKN